MITGAAALLGVSLGGAVGWWDAIAAARKAARVLIAMDKQRREHWEKMTPEQQRAAKSALENHETFRGGVI